MSRRPRKCENTKFFHIIVQGINKEYIFSEERYKKQYIKLLYKYKENTGIKIIAFCIMNNHAHFLIFTESVEQMSKYMHKVNTSYAKYYNYVKTDRVGYVFRDRFVSENILDQKYLVNCINYIHLNPVKAGLVEKCEDYKYSSYQNFLNGNAVDVLSRIVGTIFNVEMFKKTKCIEAFKDIEVDRKQLINDRIENCVISSNMEREEILGDNVVLKRIVKYLKNNCEIKYVEMMKFLNISSGRMRKLKS